VLLSGALLLFAPGPLRTVGVTFVGAVFPASQLAGALALVRGRAPSWIVPTALGLGLLRLMGPELGLGALVPWIGYVVEPAGTLAAAGVLLLGTRQQGAPVSLVALPPLLALAALADGLSAWDRSVAGAMTAPVGAAWVVLVLLTVPLQIHAVVQRRMGRQERLHRQTQEELRQVRERFRALSESSFDLVAELDSEERLTYVNPRYEEVLGHPRGALLGRRPAEFLHPDDVAAASAFAGEAGEKGVASGLVVRAHRKDGSLVWLESAARSFETPDGVRRWVMNSRDVTDRVAGEAQRERARERLEEMVAERTMALRASEARFRALAEYAPELISEFDARGRYTFANQSFLDLLGRDPRGLLGTSPEGLLHPDDVPASWASMERALRERTTSHAVHRLRHADGSWRWFDNTGRAYRTATDELRFVSIGRDVTEVREAERERARLEAHMQEVQRLESLGLLAGGIAHDFNNLLAVILGNTTLLEGEDSLGGEARDRLRRIRAAARHAEALTDQMLAYAGKSVSDPAPLDLSDLVRGTEDLLVASVSRKCRLELDLADTALRVLGDATRLRQVLLNLVVNASEAMGESGGHVRVRTGACHASAAELADGYGATERPEGTWAFLEVADDGAGMDDAQRQRIFEPFFTTKRSGRGLGLAAVLGIAGAHRGVLRVESARGTGSRFRLLLPPCDRAPAVEAPAPAPVQAECAPVLVLVVDDDEAVCEVAQAFLERAGFRVESCCGGREALARLRERADVSAVLLDLAMPDLSGAEVLRVLRAEQPDLPVVVASGYKHDLAAERLGPDAVCAIVQKPYEPEVLVATLREAIAGRSGQGPA